MRRWLAIFAVVLAVPATAQAARPLVVAHRGGALLWPENSLRAFRGALALGADVVRGR